MLCIWFSWETKSASKYTTLTPARSQPTSVEKRSPLQSWAGLWLDTSVQPGHREPHLWQSSGWGPMGTHREGLGGWCVFQVLSKDHWVGSHSHSQALQCFLFLTGYLMMDAERKWWGPPEVFAHSANPCEKLIKLCCSP